MITEQLKKISRELQITLIVNLHQVNIALKYSDRILGVNKGKLVFDGRPDELSADRIAEIYGAESGKLFTEQETKYAA